MGHLTAEDTEFFKENGYLVVRGALEQEAIDAALDRLWEALDEDRNDPESWIRKGYRSVPVGNEEVISGTTYNNRVFAMAEELAGKDKLNTSGGAGPHINFPDPDRKWSEPGGTSRWVTTRLRTVCRKGSSVRSRWVPRFISTQSKNGVADLLSGQEVIGFGQNTSDTMTWIAFQGVAPRLTWGPSYEFTGGAGDVCFWHHQMSHTAGPNCGRNVRIACISRYRRKDLDQIKFETPDDMWKILGTGIS